MEDTADYWLLDFRSPFLVLVISNENPLSLDHAYKIDMFSNQIRAPHITNVNPSLNCLSVFVSKKERELKEPNWIENFKNL